MPPIVFICSHLTVGGSYSVSLNVYAHLVGTSHKLGIAVLCPLRPKPFDLGNKKQHAVLRNIFLPD